MTWKVLNDIIAFLIVLIFYVPIHLNYIYKCIYLYGISA